MLELVIMEATGVLPTYCGTWNASINTPKIMSGIGEAGSWFKVSHDGNTNIDGVTKWKMGDVIFFDGHEWSGLTYTMVFNKIEKDVEHESEKHDHSHARVLEMGRSRK